MRMLLAATIRARCSAAERSCISAYSGTMKKPPNRPSPNRSNSTRRVPGACSSSVKASGAGGGMSGEAKARSRPNTVRPMEPSGTRPISTSLPDSRSQSIEPAPMPRVKMPSNRVTPLSVPPSTSLA
ncbi:hypothetical protein D3C75_985640 [compost metagenome]